MSQRNFIFSDLSDEKAHFCVTLRFAGDPNALTQFRIAVEESLIALQLLNDQLIQEGKQFPGNARMYCAIADAMTPIKNEMPIEKYVENLFFGELGAKDTIRAYFLAQLDPYE